MKRYQNDPRVIRARFDGVCAETGKRIRKGEECIYYPSGKKLYAMDSKQADEFRSWQFDVNALGCDY